MAKDLLKSAHGAGGFVFSLTDKKGNTRYGSVKKQIIVNALQDKDTEGVYITTKGSIKRQFLNGTCEFL